MREVCLHLALHGVGWRCSQLLAVGRRWGSSAALQGRPLPPGMTGAPLNCNQLQRHCLFQPRTFSDEKITLIFIGRKLFYYVVIMKFGVLIQFYSFGISLSL